jgi:hypothetical protein
MSAPARTGRRTRPLVSLDAGVAKAAPARQAALGLAAATAAAAIPGTAARRAHLGVIRLVALLLFGDAPACMHALNRFRLGLVALLAPRLVVAFVARLDLILIAHCATLLCA